MHLQDAAALLKTRFPVPQPTTWLAKRGCPPVMSPSPPWPQQGLQGSGGGAHSPWAWVRRCWAPPAHGLSGLPRATPCCTARASQESASVLLHGVCVPRLLRHAMRAIPTSALIRHRGMWAAPKSGVVPGLRGHLIPVGVLRVLTGCLSITSVSEAAAAPWLTKSCSQDLS